MWLGGFFYFVLDSTNSYLRLWYSEKWFCSQLCKLFDSPPALSLCIIHLVDTHRGTANSFPHSTDCFILWVAEIQYQSNYQKLMNANCLESEELLVQNELMNLAKLNLSQIRKKKLNSFTVLSWQIVIGGRERMKCQIRLLVFVTGFSGNCYLLPPKEAWTTSTCLMYINDLWWKFLPDSHTTDCMPWSIRFAYPKYNQMLVIFLVSAF